MLSCFCWRVRVCSYERVGVPWRCITMCKTVGVCSYECVFTIRHNMSYVGGRCLGIVLNPIIASNL